MTVNARPSLFDALETWIESCRDLGRGALRSAEVESMEPGYIYLETALEVLDRQADNILGRVVAMKHREANDA